MRQGIEGQDQGRKVLLDYIHETYPGKTLDQFIDLSTKECQALHGTVRDLDWGMYFTLTDKTNLIT